MAKVLVIEDEAPILQAYGLVLTKKGHQVFLAESGEKGLQMATENQPDIILLDLMMPGMSGIDMLKQLDIKKTLPKTKLVVMSNIEAPKVMEQAKALGADKYLLKINYTPYQVDEIIKDLV